LVGRLLDDRYSLVRRVARGGTATVYEARDLRLERVCAVKVMQPDLGDPDEFRARFVREAHAAARLSHPNVVAVTDQGDDRGVLFLVMEYVPGRTLRDVVREEAPLSPRRALALLDPVLADHVAQGPPGDVLHDEEQHALVVALVGDRHDVGVGEASGGVRLAHEPGAELLGVAEVGVHDLDRADPLEPQVTGLVDGRGPASCHPADERVAVVEESPDERVGTSVHDRPPHAVGEARS